MHRLRTRLIAVFLLATLAPLALTIWLVRELLDRSFNLTSTHDLDQVSRSLELTGREISWGNPTQVILISFLGGVQLISIGILGEYIGRIYEEVRARPKFIVDRAEGFARR